MAYGTRDQFITPTQLDDYAGAVKDCWGKRALIGVYLLFHWLNVSLRVVSQSQKDSHENCSEDEDIVSCEWTKELFVNLSDPDLIKRVEEKYEALDGIEKGLITYLKIALDEMFNMSDVVITSLQEFFKNFAWDDVAK